MSQLFLVKMRLFILLLFGSIIHYNILAQYVNNPDLLLISSDIEQPLINEGNPMPGKAVLQYLPEYVGSKLAHVVYLPRNWNNRKRYPVIVEYLGNSTFVKDLKGIAYAITKGNDFIWIVLPFVSLDHSHDVNWWWGDVEATVSYAKKAIPLVCNQWGGAVSKIVLMGYSRGAIACNYIGLHDDEISKLWKGIVAVSHYDDGHIPWGMESNEQALAPERLKRLRYIPQLICGEYCSIPQQGSDKKLREIIKEKNICTFNEAKNLLSLQPITEVEGTLNFLQTHHPKGNYTIVNFPWVNHGSQTMYRDTPERKLISDWIKDLLK